MYHGENELNQNFLYETEAKAKASSGSEKNHYF